ncbi:HTH-type transcriptional activator Btr [compost metagenome]
MYKSELQYESWGRGSMDYLNQMYLHIYFILRRKTTGEWVGSRKHLSGHTLYWVHEGEGSFTTQESVEVKSGSLVYAPPGLNVSYQSHNRNPMNFTIIRFECITVEAQANAWVTHPVEHLRLPLLVATTRNDHVEMEGMMTRLIRKWNPASPCGEVGSKAALSEVLHYISQNCLLEKVSQDALFEKIKETLQLHYQDSIRIEQLARNHGISSVYLRKLFHTHEGCSPKQYLDSIRYQNALRLLLHSDLSIQWIAEACGYTDEFHFSKVFKRITGLAPSKYRKEFHSR